METETIAEREREEQPRDAEGAEPDPVAGGVSEERPVTEPEVASEAPVATPLARRSGSERLQSLDAFRGLTIFGMLLVNNVALGGATPHQLLHAHWNAGIHLADLVFPWFLFIVGVAIPYASASHRKKGLPFWSYSVKALGRCVTLIFLGCLIDSALSKRALFDLDVLQLIGLAYLVGALLYELPRAARLGIAALFLVGHWWAIKHLSVGGLPAGGFTETDNLIFHVNQLYLGQYHLNGLVSVIPTAALVLIGTAVGDLLREQWPAGRRLLFLVGGGVLLALLGALWNLDLPYNKPVWTASYILEAAGTGTLTLAAFYGVMDVLKWRWWAYPLLVFGSNAIVAYVAPILVKVFILREWTWHVPDGGRRVLEQAFLLHSIHRWGRVPGGWIYTLGYIGVWWLVLWVLYRKKLFLRV